MTCSVSAGVAVIMYSPRHAREGTEARVSVEHREIIDRLVKDVLNRGRLDMIEDLYTPSLAGAARRWITPFLTSFSDLDMRVVDVVSEGDRAAARFSCSGTHTGTWQGHPPTGRRFVALRGADAGFMSGPAAGPPRPPSARAISDRALTARITEITRRTTASTVRRSEPGPTPRRPA